MNQDFKAKSAIKIQFIEKKIKGYQTKYPQRNWEQKHELSALWVELLYWQLVEKGEIQPDPLFFKAEELWKNLKRVYQRESKLPYEDLKTFLTKQSPKYTEYLINFIHQENKKEYLKLAKRLSKLLKKVNKPL